jgi:hypothetical protein
MDSTDMAGIRIGVTDAGSALHTHFTVADSPGAAGDFVASLKPSDFKGYDPLSVTGDLRWIGREDLSGRKGLKRRDIAATLGDYVENDHKQIASASSKMESLIDSIDLTALKRMLLWSNSRGKVNAGRLLAGADRYRRTARRSAAPVEAVALVVPTGANCGTPAEVIFARTAVALAAAELLGEAGFAVEVWAYAYSQGCLNDKPSGTSNTLACVRIKDADEPLNMAIAASAGSAWFFRTGLFGMWAHHGNATGGLGHARDITSAEAEVVRDVVGLDKAHVMKVGSGQRNVEEAIKAGVADVVEALSAWIGGGEA